MNGYSILFTAVFLVILAAVASTLSWGVIRGASSLSRRPTHRRIHHR